MQLSPASKAYSKGMSFVHLLSNLN